MCVADGGGGGSVRLVVASVFFDEQTLSIYYSYVCVYVNRVQQQQQQFQRCFNTDRDNRIGHAGDGAIEQCSWMLNDGERLPSPKCTRPDVCALM